MPETENTPNLEMRTCVTCGKGFYVNLDDEKIRATNGIAPRRECYDCLCARMQLIKEQARINKGAEGSELVSEGLRIYKSKLFMEAFFTTLFFGFFSIAIAVGILSHRIPVIGIFVVILLIAVIVGLWMRYRSI